MSMRSDENPDDVAVVGMSLRVPRAKNSDEFWANLRAGVECRTEFTDDELLAAGVPPELLGDPRLVRAKPIIDDIDMFDASLFGYAPREAELIDPQQRIFLECAWEALESAGYDAQRYEGSIGVFAGGGPTAYFLVNIFPNGNYLRSVGISQALLSNDKDFLATRVSYKLNLKGPSLNIVTGCSTSLVAVHQAVQSLLNRESDLALAGGVTFYIPQRAGYIYEEGGVNSAEGHCRAFDEKADGTVPGDGAGIVVLERLDDALAHGAEIVGVIKGSAVNNDGSAKASFAAPSADAQASVIKEALAVADAEPASIGYVEAHGTATKIGDAIELAGLTRAFGPLRLGQCAIGSLKPNIGHTAAAAGVASLIKVLLSLKHEELPPSINCAQPNPQLNLDQSPFYINTRLADWKRGPSPRLAGVSSFGMGGTNAHVVVQEAPAVTESGPARPWQLIVLSAHTPTALESTRRNLARHLSDHPELSIADVAYTLQVGRRELRHRSALVCTDAAGAVAALEGERSLSGRTPSKPGRVVFLFPGQGSQYVGMGHDLYLHQPAYREHVDTCAAMLHRHLGLDLRSVLYARGIPVDEAEQKLEQTWLTQPALFVAEYALARLLMEWGIAPAAMCGHSIGEYVAACLSGVLSLEDALRVVATRGRLVQEQPAGAMVAVQATESDVAPLIGPGLSIAAVNAVSQVVVAGSASRVRELTERLSARKLRWTVLSTSHAFHSHFMEPAMGPLSAALAGQAINAPAIPYLSNVTGDWVTSEQVQDPGYWARQLRQPVRFLRCAEKLAKLDSPILVEVGPGDTLRRLIADQARPSERIHSLSTLPGRRRQTAVTEAGATLAETVGKLWLVGVTIDWEAFSSGERRRRVQVPTYPFERHRYWVQQPAGPLPHLAPEDFVRIAPTAAPPPMAEQILEDTAGDDPDEVAERPELANPYVEPRNDIERGLAGIWSETMGICEIGAEDNFFELGGHSLLAARLIGRALETFAVEVSIVDLFTEDPTIAGMARIIERQLAQGAE